MKSPLVRTAVAGVALALAVATPSSQAIAPIVALLAKQIIKDMVTSTAKSMLFDALDGMGCKGMAISNALQSLDGIKGGLPRGLPGMGGMPTMPAMPAGMAGMPPGMTGLPTMPGMPGLPPGMAMPPGMAGLPGMSGIGSVPPDMAAAMTRMMPAGSGLSADQAAQMNNLMASMGAPLSPLETIAVIDEMTELGMLPKAMNTELKECMVLIPSAAPMLGMGMGMMKPMLPQMRAGRDQMFALSPTEQDELAETLGQEFDKAPAADRRLMLTELGGGMFPPRVVDALKKRYGVK